MQNQIGSPPGFVDKRQTTKGGSNNVSLATPANYDSVAAMIARLQAVNAAYYTTARVNQMSYNDLVFALRHADDLASIR